jgi:hypothetical protein
MLLKTLLLANVVLIVGKEKFQNRTAFTFIILIADQFVVSQM